jgi:tRNA U34 5-methylaminomethyl-2-thiouridine-forming methyltransferase MnmC
MERKLRITEDGSHTVEVPGLGPPLVTYHSIHGAVQESREVYIKAGLLAAARGLHTGPRGLHATEADGFTQTSTAAPALRVLEMGFGTGLNALLTFQEAIRLGIPIYYQTIEQYPLTPQEYEGLNYEEILHNAEKVTSSGNGTPLMGILRDMHGAVWEADIRMHPLFTLHKIKGSFLQREFHKEGSDVLYYDAFAPDTQPELWQVAVFEKLFTLLKPGGLMVTYCAKGEVRRALMASGFVVEKLPGPPGKREMIRAWRPI